MGSDRYHSGSSWYSFTRRGTAVCAHHKSGKLAGTIPKGPGLVHLPTSDGKTDAEVRRGMPKVTGVYVKGSVCGVDVIFTIDTGASTSMISQRVYKEISKANKPSLQAKNPLVNSADGKPIDCTGDAKFDILFGPIYMEKSFTIGDITDDVLLGADILLGDESGPADLMLSQKVIRFRDTEIPIEVAGYPRDRIRRVTVADEYVIPPMSEALVDVFVEKNGTEEQCDFILEPDPSLAERYSVAMAASMVDVNRTVTQAVRIMNPFPTPTKLHQDCLIGYAEPVEQVTVLKETEDDLEKTNMITVRSIANWREVL